MTLNYRAEIGPGLCILHSTQGCVIGPDVVIGDNLTMVGGNIIGRKKNFTVGEYIIGNNVELGANAVIIGPLKIGNNVKIGASACVVKDSGSNITLVGVPAHQL